MVLSVCYFVWMFLFVLIDNSLRNDSQRVHMFVTSLYKQKALKTRALLSPWVRLNRTTCSCPNITLPLTSITKGRPSCFLIQWGYCNNFFLNFGGAHDFEVLSSLETFYRVNKFWIVVELCQFSPNFWDSYRTWTRMKTFSFPTLTSYQL